MMLVMMTMILHYCHTVLLKIIGHEMIKKYRSISVMHGFYIAKYNYDG